MKTFDGKLVTPNMKVGSDCARFNHIIVYKRLSGIL